MKKILSILILSIAILSTGYSQTCGTHVTQRQMQYLDQTKVQRENYTMNKSNLGRMPLSQVPIQVHMVRSSAGTGGLSSTQVTSLINDMNVYYANANMEFIQCNAINYVDNDTYHDFDNADETVLATANDVVNVINIYFFNSITSGSTALCGYSRFPPSVDRIFMVNSCATNGSTMTHEMGHYFSLYHTHGKSNTGTTDELVNGVNCTILGDDICDTSADPNLSGLVTGGCLYTGTGTDINSQFYVPDPTNVMSYSLKACRTNLSAGQYNRVAFALANDRNYLVCATLPGYCASNATSTSDTEIDNVTFNSINQSSASNCTVYTDYTGVSTNVTLGQSYTLSISTGDCNGGTIFNRGIAAYIDWNGDKDYDDVGEQLILQANSATLTASTNVTIPLTATVGTTEMRIIVTETGTVGPCGTYTYGETEDYTIVIDPPFCATTISSYPYNQNFESFTTCSTTSGTTCSLSSGWTNETGDDIDWTTDIGGTTSASTGPTTDYNPGTTTGKYLYTEATGTAGSPTKEAIVSSPCFNLTSLTTPELTFAYNMYGINMGVMNVEVSTGGAWTSVWNMSGDQGTAWAQATVDLSAYTSQTIKIRFRGVTGSNYESDMAIDDITIQEAPVSIGCTATINAFPSNFKFEGFTLCNQNSAGLSCPLNGVWTNSSTDDIDWYVMQGATTSTGTGPTTDYNPGTTTGKYLYVEASGTGSPSKEAILNSPCYNLSTTNTQLVFGYNMYGNAMGTMSVDISTNSGVSYTNVWSLTGDQGTAWAQATVDLSVYDGLTIKIRFRGVTGSSYTSDMAIDDVTIQSAPITACTPIFTFTPNGAADGDFINNFVLGSISNLNTGGIAGPDYNDYSSMSTNIIRSQAYIADVTNGTWTTDNIAIWIDYNQDGDFLDAGEKLGEQATTAANQTRNFNFTVPAGAVLGTTNMRVRLVFGGSPIDPCATYTYGETEDYSVVIMPACSLPTPSVSANSRCGTGTVTLSATPGTGGSNCVWYAASTGGTALSTGTTFTTPSISANTTYYVSTTDGTCESTTRIAVTATVNTIPTVSFSNLNASYCVSSSSVTLSGSPTGGTFSGSGISGNTFSPSAAGTGMKTITYTYTAGNGCTNTSTQNVTINALPSVNYSGLAGTYCSNDPNVTLSGSPSGGTFSGSGISGNTFSPSSATIGVNTIVYSYTDGNSCINTSSQNVTIYSTPTANFTGLSTTYCSSDPTITLTGTPTGGSFSGAGISGNTFAPSMVTGMQTITYSYTNGNGCTDTYTQNVTVNTIPSVSISGLLATYCVSSGAITLNGSPTGGTYSGTGVSGNSFTPSTAGVGTHSITYTFTNGNGCTNNTIQSVSVIASPTASIAGLNSDYCIDAIASTLTGTPTGGAFSGNGISGNTFSPSSAGTGTHMIIYDFNAGGGCADRDTLLVTVNNIPTVSFAGFNSNYCTSDPIATLVGTPIGGTFAGSGITGNDFDAATAGSGTHSITYSYTDSNSCSNTDVQSTTVSLSPIASISGLNTGYCETDGDVTFTVSPSGGVITGTGVSGLMFSPSNAGAGTHVIHYSFMATNGCIGVDSIVVNVTTSAAAVANFTPTVSGMDVTFANSSTNTSGWSWTFGDNGTDNIENPEYTYTAFGTFNVCLTAVNACGNTDQFCMDVVIVDTNATSGPDAINDILNKSISLFPNPTTGNINLEISLKEEHTISYELIDIVGRSIKRVNTLNNDNFKAIINMNALQSGVYFMKINVDNETIIKKIVLKK